MPSRIWYIFRRGILFDPFDSIRIAVSFRSIVDEAIFRLQEASAASALATFHCFFLFPYNDNEGMMSLFCGSAWSARVQAAGSNQPLEIIMLNRKGNKSIGAHA